MSLTEVCKSYTLDDHVRDVLQPLYGWGCADAIAMMFLFRAKEEREGGRNKAETEESEISWEGLRRHDEHMELEFTSLLQASSSCCSFHRQHMNFLRAVASACSLYIASKLLLTC